MNEPIELGQVKDAVNAFVGEELAKQRKEIDDLKGRVRKLEEMLARSVTHLQNEMDERTGRSSSSGVLPYRVQQKLHDLQKLIRECQRIGDYYSIPYLKREMELLMKDQKTKPESLPKIMSPFMESF